MTSANKLVVMLEHEALSPRQPHQSPCRETIAKDTNVKEPAP